MRTILRRDVITPLSKRFPTTAGDIGFEHGRFHSFRHFFVSQCFAHGASEGEVKAWVGHRDSAMVAHYRHMYDDLSQQRIQQVNFVSDAQIHPANGPSGNLGTSTQEHHQRDKSLDDQANPL